MMYRHPLLRTDLRGLPESLFSSSINREAFRRWLAGGGEVAPAEDDVVAAHIAHIEGRRLPPLSSEDAAKAVQRKIREILKERAILHQMAVTETVAEAERVLGARHVSDVASEAWLSVSQPDADAQVAESVIEQMELGFSIHRREDPARS